MKRVRRELVQRWVTFWQDLLSLREWKIGFALRDEEHFGHGDDTWYAECNVNAGRLETGITLAAERLPDDIHETVCHELAHLSLTDLRVVFNTVLQSLPPGQADLARAMWDQREEQVARKLGRCMVRMRTAWHKGLSRP